MLFLSLFHLHVRQWGGGDGIYLVSFTVSFTRATRGDRSSSLSFFLLLPPICLNVERGGANVSRNQIRAHISPTHKNSCIYQLYTIYPLLIKTHVYINYIQYIPYHKNSCVYQLYTIYISAITEERETSLSLVENKRSLASPDQLGSKKRHGSQCYTHTGKDTTHFSSTCGEEKEERLVDQTLEKKKGTVICC